MAPDPFLETYDELDHSIAEMTVEEFSSNRDYFIWNAIDHMLEYEDSESYDSNDEEPEHGN
jgi:hypothetical protein